MLQGGFRQLLLFLLRPAQIGAPQWKPVRNQHIKQPNIERQPPIVSDRSFHATFALEENILHPGHQARCQKVENTQPPPDLAQQAPAIDVMQQEQEKDWQLDAECDDDAVAKVRVGVAPAGIDNDYDYADAAGDEGGEDGDAAEGLHSGNFDGWLCFLVFHSISLFRYIYIYI